MAITTDTGAKKIEGTENWRNIFGIHNDTVDAYDALAEQKDEEIGIVVKGNKTAHTGGAAAGQYIILRNSTITGCDDGLYKAAQAIPYDTAIDSTYLTPVSGGGLNELNASLNWTLLATTPFSASPQTITIPLASYHELYITCLYDTGNSYGQILIPVVDLLDRIGKDFIIGCYNVSPTFNSANIIKITPVSNTSLQVTTANQYMAVKIYAR